MRDPRLSRSPARAKNASSSVGWLSEASSTVEAGLSSASSTARRSRGPVGRGDGEPAGAHVELGVEALEAAARRSRARRRPAARRARAGRRRGASAAPACPRRRSCRRCSTTISSASRSASSRYCVVSTSAAPSSTRPSIAPHISARLDGSRPVVGSSRNTTGRCDHQARGEVQPAAHAAAVGADLAVGGVRDPEALQQRARARDRVALGELLQPRRAASGSRGRSGARRARPAGRRARSARARRPARRRRRGRPTNARPVVGASSVVRMRTAVVLPAPLWPSRPSTVPGSTARSSPLSASVSPIARVPAGPACSYSVRHGTPYDSGTLYEMSREPKAADLGAGRAARPRPARSAVARADRQGRAARSPTRKASRRSRCAGSRGSCARARCRSTTTSTAATSCSS